jgi:predicted nucleic acid-binding protein
MKYLLDSNIVSEPVKAKPDPAVVAWLDSHELECAVSTITLAELRYGIERLPQGKRRRQLERDFAFFRQRSGAGTQRSSNRNLAATHSGKWASRIRRLPPRRLHVT